ncbi:MAG: succinate dehydrogenase iron-sulfur protein [Actinomycetota bacterium]
MSHLKNLKLKVWRQSGPADSGRFENYTIDEISDEASFLEMLDVLNESLITENRKPWCLITIVVKEFAERAR